MALSGVRSSCDIDARKRDLARVSLFGPPESSSERDFAILEFGDQVVFSLWKERSFRLLW